MAEGSASSTAGLSTALPWEKNGKSGRRALPPPGLRPPSSESESAGVKVTARASEVSRAAVMVTASARKKLPVTPVVAISGRKTTTGVMVEKTSGVASSCSAMRMAVVRDWPASRWTTMFSTTTMASSMTRPMAAARPPRVIRLKDCPMAQRKRIVTATVTGITRPATSELDQSRRKRKRIMQASTSPMKMASRTLAMDSRTSSDWS